MKNWKKTWNKLYGGRWYRRILMWLLTFFTLSLLGLLAIDNNLFGWFGHSPSLEEIRRARYANKETSVIYSEDNVLLNRCYDEDRTWVEYTDLPPLLTHSLTRRMRGSITTGASTSWGFWQPEGTWREARHVEQVP